MQKNVTVTTFEDRDALFKKAGEAIATWLNSAIVVKGQGSLMLSGGRSPLGLFPHLQAAPIDWIEINIGLVDERWVAPDDAASNEGLLRRALLQGPVAEANFLPMKTKDDDPKAAVTVIDALYKKAQPPFDVVVLGLGEDGHTASLFPRGRGLDNALHSQDHLVAPLYAKRSSVTGAHTIRMSLTVKAISQAHHRLFILLGSDKKAVFERALDAGPVEDMPVRAIIRDGAAPCDIFYAP